MKLSNNQKTFFFVVPSSLLFFFLLLFFIQFLFTPDFEEVVQSAVGSDHTLMTPQGEPIQILRTDYKKRRLNWHQLRDFSPVLKDAIIRTEDHRFQFHIGIDIFSLARAVRALFVGKKIQGASTITMQVSDLIQKKVLVNNQPIVKGSWVHKIGQAIRSLCLELKWSKNQILEAYLNLIHLRGEYQGIPSFSYAYFSKHPLGLDAYESVVLASLISAPNQNLEALKKKSCQLFTKLTSQISSSCEPLSFVLSIVTEKPRGVIPMPNLAPHLARRLFHLYPHQTTIHSFLDLPLQKKVMDILQKNISLLENKNVNDSAAIVLENSTGHVIAYVGALASSQNNEIDGIQALRQAGSTLKPFIYARAIDEKNLTAASILSDDPTTISWNGMVYRPTNYNRLFYGDVSVREALGSSLNVPAVKIASILGIRETYNIFRELHFSGLQEPDFYGVSMALGAIDVRLDELVNAYRTFNQKGKWSPLVFSDQDSNLAIKSNSIFSPAASFIISHILSDANARSIGFGWNSPLETSFWSAAKTGTSKDYRDNWCVGWSEDFTVGVWAGNFNAEGMNRVSGVAGAAPSWQEIMEYLHKNRSSHSPSIPAGVITKEIRHNWKSYPSTEYFLNGTEPSHTLIEAAPEKNIKFVFPAEGSVLLKDPKIEEKRIGLFVRFKGTTPKNSLIKMNNKVLGEAVSPFKIEKIEPGTHFLSIVSKEGNTMASVHFTVR